MRISQSVDWKQKYMSKVRKNAWVRRSFCYAFFFLAVSTCFEAPRGQLFLVQGQMNLKVSIANKKVIFIHDVLNLGKRQWDSHSWNNFLVEAKVALKLAAPASLVVGSISSRTKSETLLFSSWEREHLVGSQEWSSFPWAQERVSERAIGRGRARTNVAVWSVANK